MRKLKVKHFNDEKGLTAFIDKALARCKRISVQTTQTGYTVCY